MSVGAKVLMISGRNNREDDRGGNRSPRNDYGMDNAYPGFRNDGDYGMRSAHNYPRTNPDMNYGDVENRFRDRRGREHYDNGRFSPMRGAMDDMEDNYEVDNRRYSRREDGRFAPRNDGYMNYGDMRGNDGRDGSGGRMHYPFGPVPPVYEREPNMNRIGFAAREEVNTGHTDAGYSHMNEMEYRNHEPMRGGASGTSMELTEEMAHEWMHGLHNEDGTKGPHWSMDQVKQVMSQKGVKMDPMEFWVILNAMYSDYCGVLKKHNVNNMDFYVDLAKAWLGDKDAKEGKAARYFQYIVK